MEHLIKKATWGNKKVGQCGERAAEVYLKAKGHVIVDKNVRFKRGEIDILSKSNTTLHVVEVKTSKCKFDGEVSVAIEPEESFSKRKIATLRYLANEVLSKYGGKYSERISEDVQIQIDGIAIRLYFDKNMNKIKKITARYYPAIA